MVPAQELLQGIVGLVVAVLLLVGARRRFGAGQAEAGPHDVGLD